MENKLTNLDVVKFLGEVKKSSKIEFLEEGKEKDDLIQSAKKRGILIEGSRDLAVLKTIFLFTDTPNSNGAIIPSKEFKRIFPTVVGKPMDIGHNRRYVVGFYIDYKYIEKKNMAITYAVFFKSNFPDEYKKAKQFHKKGKLSSSFEIWSDNNKTEAHKDGSYTLHRLELAGGALIFEEKGEEPAFKDAKCLEISKKINLEEYVDEKVLVYASKYHKEGIIVAEKDYFKEEVQKNVEKLNQEKETPKKTEEPKLKETPKEETPKVEEKKPEKVEEKKPEPIPEPIIPPKIKCSNCGEEQEHNAIDIRIKCPKCFAILNKEGVMQYPPQIQDFKVLCPSCKVGMWLILKKSDKEAKLRCETCAKEYNIGFVQDNINVQQLIEKFNFLYTGSVSCPQCHYRVPVTGVSSLKERTIKCPKCDIEFSFNITHESYRKISNIKEIKSEKTLEKSKEGGKQMETKEKKGEKKPIKAKEEKTVKSTTEVKTSEVKESPKTEEKVEKVIKKAKAKVEDKKVETKVKETPKKEESKTEVKPKVADKDDELPADMQYEAEFGKPELDYPTVEKAKAEVIEKPDRYRNAVRKAIKKVMDIKKALKKIKADKAEMEEILKSGVNKIAKKYLELKKTSEEKINFYKSNAKTIYDRREELGEFATELTDKQIVDDKDYKIAKLNKEVAEKEDEKQPEVASETVGDKTKKNEYYTDIRKQVNANAFPKIEKKK